MIASYYQQIAKLNALKKRFSTLKTNLGVLVSDLNNASLELGRAVTGINVNFTVNDVSADNDSIKDNKDSIDDMISYINGNVFQSIAKKIEEIDNNIAYYYELIRLAEEREKNKNDN